MGRPPHPALPATFSPLGRRGSKPLLLRRPNSIALTSAVLGQKVELHQRALEGKVAVVHEQIA